MVNDDDRRREGRKRGHGHGRGRRDFWHDWHAEYDGAGPPPSRRERARMWRQFFHEYTGEWPEDHWAFGGRRFSPWQKGNDQFNPFVAMLLSKGGGLLPLIVLQSLQERPRYGNDIMDHITELTRGQWVANPGAIYPLMTMLEEQGFVVGDWDDPRKRTVRVYRLTEAGTAELDRLRAIVRPKLMESIDVMEDIGDALAGNGRDDLM